MIRTHVTAHDLDIVGSAYLTDQPTNLPRNVATQYRLAVLRDEHKVVTKPIHRVRCTTILTHTYSVPLPPEGFA